MTYINKTIVELLIELFGFPRRYSHGQSDVPFNCPKCDAGGNKYNLEVNTVKGIFHCWSCGYKGKLGRLFKDYGTVLTDKQWAVINQLPTYNTPAAPTYGKVSHTSCLQSIGSFRTLTTEWNDSIHYFAALKYLNDRGIDERLIKKWDIAYAEQGPNKFRIIVPSRSQSRNIEYYVARSFYPTVLPKYKNPSIAKQDIIFGESFIDWHRPVVLVEGVFDALVALNAVPILGTEIKSHKKLLSKIRAHSTPVVVCLDSEAWEKAKEAYKVLDDFDIDTKIIRMEQYKDLSDAYEHGGKVAVLSILDSAHKLTFEESLF